MLLGVDVHTEYQAGLNIEQLAREGMSFVVVKATQSAGGYVAPAAFDDWIRRTRAAGMIPGAYHWLDSSDPVRQADVFLARLAPVGGPDGLLLQIDCEDTKNPATAEHLRRFVDQMNRRTGGHPLLLYTGQWWWSPRMGGFDAAVLGLKLWHSRYVGPTHASPSRLVESVLSSWWTPGYGGWSEATILQYSSKANAGGMTANLDVNAFRGTRDDLLSLTQGGTVDAATELALKVAFADRYDGRTGIHGQSWMAQAVETPLRALVVASAEEKTRDAVVAVQLAGMNAVLTKMADALAAGGTGTPLDTAAVIQAVRDEAEAVRELVENRHAAEMARAQHDRDAETAGLLAHIRALEDEAAGK